MTAAWDNAIAAVLPSPFVADVAAAVTNDGSDDGAARWLLLMACDHLRRAGEGECPLAAFDFAAYDFEAIGAAWPMMTMMADLLAVDRAVTIPLARFVAERLPGIWSHAPFRPHPPVTRAVVLADRAHDLVGLFSVGLKPNGSKDPFALRRAANHWLMQVVFRTTAGPFNVTH